MTLTNYILTAALSVAPIAYDLRIDSIPAATTWGSSTNRETTSEPSFRSAGFTPTVPTTIAAFPFQNSTLVLTTSDTRVVTFPSTSRYAERGRYPFFVTVDTSFAIEAD